MICPRCGAEIKENSKFCEFCGSQITIEMRKEQEQLNKAGCPKCGSLNITFNREKQGEIRGENGIAVVRNTVGFCKDCGYTWSTTDGSEKKKKDNSMIWWVLGWLFFFPITAMIFIWRKENTWDKKVKIGVTVAFWLIFFIIGVTGDNTETTANTIDVSLDVSSNVNADDGTVLFNIATNLPEDTILMVTIKNDKGFMAQDKAVVLASGVASTAEFSNAGKGLSGKYTVTVSMSLPKLQKESVQEIIGQNGENISGQYVHPADISDANIVSGDFEFEF